MGIIMNALSLGIKTSVVTDLSLYENALLEKGMTSVVDLKNDEGVVSKIKEADYIVSATGIKNALDRPSWVLALLNSKAIFANMGVEDEYGPLISDSMVLNEKKPLNFLLEEPTHLKFIDASLALHNVLSLALLNTSGKGICDIPKALEDHILNVTRQHGEIL